ncbi:MAG TPA: glycoside hydrolase family 20 zincin-like fold domain-containing protein, partial [Gemmatimonadaceae bacterium]|nr:glycoside hydrolase family 20 zincin-like fold domain-containing protein [Gemmatimonadaceae bacterium]
MPTRFRFVLAAMIALAVPAAARADDPHLIPKPREVTAGELAPLPKTIAVSTGASDEDKFAAKDFVDAMKERGLRVVTGADGGYRISLLRVDSPAARRVLETNKLEFDDAMKAEGYILVTTKEAATVVAATSAGLFYGVQTLKQLIRTDGAAPQIQLASIRDWPAMRYRGFQDDLSRGPVPTLDFQKKELRTLAAYKINVYSPYFEHTLAYDSNPLISPPGGGMSHADVRALVAYARRYHIDVVPEQEAFGHLHHVLKYDLYSPLGETDHGNVLAPGDPAALPLIKSWFAEIDSLFPSKFVHLGADETFELGLGRTKDRVTQSGLGPVYID